MSETILELANVSKDYRGLRPLRFEHLIVERGSQLAVLGLDQTAAEVFVNLVTGAFVPDRGEVRLFGRSTTAIENSADWLAVVDRFGIVSERAVLLDALTVVQNLALPFTLEIEPPAEDVRARAEALAQEVDIPAGSWARPVAELDAVSRARVRLGRALALDPGILLLEHASAPLDPATAEIFGRQVRAIASRRGAALVVLSADERFARVAASRVLTLNPATGQLRERRGWFRRRATSS